jgi:hypothetical protein
MSKQSFSKPLNKLELSKFQPKIEMAIASFLDTEALGFADCKPGCGQ